ncbi:DUF1707 domain-containing protein [Streptomyces sp. NPDC047973]|uniref:DUF1707 SHOCT-like domain-containing protein n=1 Tax=Streptomyces sp. NPDC047973 TaxID=3155383 RepID=UPI00342DD66C
MTSPREDRLPLLGEDDREAAVRRLQEAYASEHLSHEEMDLRLGQALAARTTEELATATASLPEPAKAPETTASIGAAGGRIRRGGAWRVPRFLKVHSAFGKVRLDLSRAVFEHGAVDIDLQLGSGGARITVPRDAVVDVEGLSTGWKDLRYKPRRPSRPGGPEIRVTGALGYGRLKIRHARR